MDNSQKPSKPSNPQSKAQQKISQHLNKLDDATLKALAQSLKEQEEKLKKKGPRNDDELHAWIVDNIGVDIPRAAVCQDTDPPHDAPFKFFADLYFERVGSALAMANRGGAKTFLVALLHFVNSTFKPGCESLTFGATEAQSLRCYDHLKNWLLDQDGKEREFLKISKMRATLWKNGSKVEVLPGTKQAVNGPHPQKAHADEVELMKQDTWEESRNMVISKKMPDGTLIKPQDILTSTRKSARGRMQELIDEIKDAKKKGLNPSYEMYAWCIYEVAAQVPNCREAPENKDKPEEELCSCNMEKRGQWDDGEDRFLNQVCNGRLYKSRGWKPYEDIVNTFKQNARGVWEAQQECRRGSTENLYLPSFSRKNNGVRHFSPDPENGPIFMGVDWGGTVPHAVNWYQLVKYPVTILDFEMNRKIIPANSLVCFDEIYVTTIPATKLGERVHQVEDYYRSRFPAFTVSARFPDPQGTSERAEWASMQRPLKTQFRATRDFEPQVTYVVDLIEDDRFYVDIDKCPYFVAEGESWRRNPETLKEVREFNHCMSNFRYTVVNVRRIHKELQQHVSTEKPVETSKTATMREEIPVVLGGEMRSEGEEWRKRFSTTTGTPIRLDT